MKRKVFLSVCLLAIGWGVCHAQDVIVTRDAKKISAKITEVNPDDVKYRNFDNPDGPTYTLLKSQIASILYQNGTVETFEAEAGTPATQPSATPSAATQPAAVNFNQQQQAGRQPRSSIRDYPVHYAEYSRGKLQRRRGVLAIIAGVIVVAAGGIDPDNDGGVFEICIGAGAVCTATGITAIVIGGNKKRRAVNNYLREAAGLPAGNTSYLQLNLHGNGLGLAYVF
jgi:hypothetical protein